MATDGPVMRFNDVEYAAGDERLLFSALLGALGGGPFSARSGKRPGSGLGATVSGLDVTVTPGAGVIYDSTYGSAGPYLFANVANRALALGPRPGTGQSRIDLIIARITDPDTIGGAAEMKIERVAGTASPTPSAPGLPPLSMEVARATVPAGAGAVSLTPSTARTVAAGGILPVATTAERDLLPSPHPGLTVYVEAEDVLYVRGESGWKRYMSEEDGAITVASSWTPDGDRPLGWVRQGSLVFLHGSMAYSATIPASGFVTLNGIPPVAYRWDGLLRNGNTNAIGAGLTTIGRLEWDGKFSSGASAFVALNGIVYRTSA